MSLMNTLKINLKKIIKSSFRRLGLEICRYSSLSLSKIQESELGEKRYSKNLLYEADVDFQKFYSEGIRISKTPDARGFAYFSKREERFYNLIQFFSQIHSINGEIIECGCWKGLSSYLICNYLRIHNPNFQGENFVIVDSFEGLSEPSEFDRITDLAVTGKEEESGQPAGAFAASIDEVKHTLSEFPNITYFKGWIPSVFDSLPEATYKFVHIDVDLYEPVHASIQYFYPRLVWGGVIIFDDYGSLYWPGARKAVNEYCLTNKISLLRLSTGQAVIWKR